LLWLNNLGNNCLHNYALDSREVRSRTVKQPLIAGGAFCFAVNKVSKCGNSKGSIGADNTEEGHWFFEGLSRIEGEGNRPVGEDANFSFSMDEFDLAVF
jgi:hypothetical protein